MDPAPHSSRHLTCKQEEKKARYLEIDPYADLDCITGGLDLAD